ncbi:TPA: flotillin family protein [bacterium]|nr:flotillin family protein [bacterium]
MRLVVAILSLAGLIILSMLIVLLTNIETTFYIVSSLVIVVLGIFFAVVYRYQMPKADQALVRTGGKRYVVRFQGGGVWVNTIFHETRPVSLNTMRMEITRVGKEESLITSDFMRADVTAVFYVKVPPNEDDVIKAAQTLGQKTLPVSQQKSLFSIGRRKQRPGAKDVEQDVMLENIKALLDDKVDGALRAVAATMKLEELQKERGRFADEVKEIVMPDLKENGLSLETVTITMLNQTPVADMDPNNRFDAIGIKEITAIIKEAAVEKESKVKKADVDITRIGVDAAKKKFVLEQDRSWAEADMQMKISTYSAEKEAETIKIQYEQEVVGQRAGIIKDQELQKVEINKTKEVEIARAEQEQKVAERMIEKNLVIETKNIEMGQKVAEREILRNLEVELKRIDQEQKVGVKDFEKELAIKKAEIAKDEGLGVREIEKMLAISINKIGQEQKVLEREIEKNKFVEIASIEMSQKVAEREIERNLEIQKVQYKAQIGIKEAEVNSLKVQYVLERDRVFAEADKEKAIQAYSATRKAEGVKIQYEQEAIAESARISKDQTIQVRDIEKSRQIEIANIEKQQKVQERDIEKNLMIQKATYNAQLGIKDAEVSSLKGQYILEKDRAIVDADQKKIIQAYSATRKAEGTKVQFEQEALIEKSRIAKDQTIMEREIEKGKVVEIAQIGAGQAIQIREIERNLEIQKSTFSANVGIKRADVDSQVKQFALEQDRSYAEADQRKRITAYTAQRQAEAAQIIYDQDVVKETARISKEQRILERDIDRGLAIELRQIDMGQKVGQADISQKLVIGLADEDRKISMELKMKQTDLATKTHLEATALRNVADVNAITVQRVGEAERDKEIAIINADREAKPMERLAEAILAQAKAKAEGQMKMIEAKNITEQRVLVQQAILQLIDTSPQIIERMMKPVEKIESIRILNMGDQMSPGLNKSSMGKLANNLMDTGAVMPMVKEFLKFADLNADDLAKKASEYLSGLIKIEKQK